MCVPLNRGQKKSSILHRAENDSEPWAFPVMLPHPPTSIVSVGGPILECNMNEQDQLMGDRQTGKGRW